MKNINIKEFNKSLKKLTPLLSNQTEFLKFKSDVKKLTPPSDYEANKSKLKLVKKYDYVVFINCLNCGVGINKSIEALGIIRQISIKTAIHPDDVFKILFEFRQLINILIEKK